MYTQVTSNPDRLLSDRRTSPQNFSPIESCGGKVQAVYRRAVSMSLHPRSEGFSIRNSRNEPVHFWNRRLASHSDDEQLHRLTSASVSPTISALTILVI